jgi:hypothetical protein
VAPTVTSRMDGFMGSLMTRAALLAVLLVPTLGQGGHVGAERAASATAHARPAGPIHVVIDAAGLRVEVRDARPADVLQTLGARSRVPVTLRGELPGRITREFSVASVEDAVREVLRGYSAALVFGRAAEGHDGRVSEIRVLAVGNAPPGAEPAAREPDSRAAVAPAPRLESIRALAKMGHVGAVEDLSRVLVEDGHPVVRARAAIGLGEFGTLRATRALMRALADPSPLVRMQAVRTLGRADPEAAVSELGAILVSDRNPGVRRVAARTLGRLETPEARAALESATGESDEPVRREITDALARSMARQR